MTLLERVSVLERVHPAALYVVALLPAVGAVQLIRAALSVRVRPSDAARSHEGRTD